MASSVEPARVAAARARIARLEGEASTLRSALVEGVESGRQAQTDFRADRMVFGYSTAVTLGGVVTSLGTALGVVFAMLGVFGIYVSGLRLWQGHVRLVDASGRLRRDRERLEVLDASIASERSMLP